MLSKKLHWGLFFHHGILNDNNLIELDVIFGKNKVKCGVKKARCICIDGSLLMRCTKLLNSQS